MAKIQFKLGSLEFLGEGDEKWVASQLDKILEKAPILQTASTSSQSNSTSENGQAEDKPHNNNTPLARFLQDKKANSNQVKRFLATAEWLGARGNGKVTTSEVTKALKDNHQSRLSNPADCLNKNVAKGYCEKDGKQFFITQDGRNSLG